MHEAFLRRTLVLYNTSQQVRKPVSPKESIPCFTFGLPDFTNFRSLLLRVPNVQVSDTTGDATKYKCRFQKKILYLLLEYFYWLHKAVEYL